MERKRNIILRVILLGTIAIGNCWGQQSYVNNRQLDCYKKSNETDGFVCNGARASCDSLVSFRPIHPYDTPTAIAYLLSSDAASIAASNNLTSEVNTIPPDIGIIVVPINCSCGGTNQFHHSGYKIESSSETYLSIANNTYQGLTTCQALMASNPSFDSRNLTVGLRLSVPLRCACPTPTQSASGVRILLNYLVTWRDDISSIAARFRIGDTQSVLGANLLSPSDVIYPFTTLLLPLSASPDPRWLLRDHHTPPPLLPSPPPPTSSNKGLVIGVSVASAAVLLLLLFFVFFCFSRNKSKTPTLPTKKKEEEEDKTMTVSSSNYTTDEMMTSSSWSQAVYSLTRYTIEELNEATDYFSEANKMDGSGVFRGSFKGDTAAVKVMKGDVSEEINILKQINHSNIIRLSGLCINNGITYLVYEYAQAGSLSHCLRSILLTWKHRVHIAHATADALNYLHNFANPPYIHNNFKSANILLDADLTPKLSDFSQARRVDQRSDGVDLTRHVVGTHGYMAPEYIHNGLITPKLDVFAFGVVLSELLSARQPTTNKGAKEQLLSDSIRHVVQGDNVREKLQEFMDPALGKEYPLDLAFSMAQLANQCVSPDLNARPSISQVFITLSKIRSSTDDWDPSDELDRSTSFTLTTHT